jgi:hypothetical protein
MRIPSVGPNTDDEIISIVGVGVVNVGVVKKSLVVHRFKHRQKLML